MKTVRSVASATSLASRVDALYGLPGPARCRLHTVGDNDTYMLRAGAERFVLRVWYPHRYWLGGIHEYRFELQWLAFCASRGLPVSTALPRRDGDLLGLLDAPEGTRPWALFTWAPGEPIYPMSIAQFVEYGRQIARFHLESTGFQSPHPRFALDADVLFHRPLQILSAHFGAEDPGVRELAELAPRLAARLRELGLPDASYGVLGGDFNGGNHHVAHDGSMTFFDFDSCAHGYRVFDLAVLAHNARLGGLPLDRLDATIRGYESLRPLSPEERAAIPLFMAGRRLMRLATRAGETAWRGEAALPRALFEQGLRSLRDWLAEAGPTPRATA